MKTTLLDKLACPVCAARGASADRRLATVPEGKASEPTTFICDACESRFLPSDGLMNFAGAVVAPRFLSSQWAMEFGPLVSMYEKIWRPTVTRSVSNFKWEVEMSRRFMALSPGLDVLDLACGTGHFTRRFSDLARPGQVIGIDLSLPMLKNGARQLAAQKNTDIVLMRVDVTRWPFAPDAFDRIHCSGALHLFPDIQGVFHSIYRSLKKGGYFVCATFCRGGGVVVRRFQNYVSTAHGFHWFAPGELESLSSRAGLTGWEQRTCKQGIVFRVHKN